MGKGEWRGGCWGGDFGVGGTFGILLVAYFVATDRQRVYGDLLRMLNANHENPNPKGVFAPSELPSDLPLRLTCFMKKVFHRGLDASLHIDA